MDFPRNGKPNELFFWEMVLMQHIKKLIALENHDFTLIIAADHGSLEVDFCDQKRPFMGIMAPDDIPENEKIAIMAKQAEVVSSFDIYTTLRHLAEGGESEKEDISKIENAKRWGERKVNKKEPRTLFESATLESAVEVVEKAVNKTNDSVDSGTNIPKKLDQETQLLLSQAKMVQRALISGKVSVESKYDKSPYFPEIPEVMKKRYHNSIQYAPNRDLDGVL